VTPELIARYCKVRTLAERGATDGERTAAATIAARMEAEHPGLTAHWPPRNVGGVGASAGTAEQRKQAWWHQIDPAFVREVVTAAAGAMGAAYERFSAGLDTDGDEPSIEDPEVRAFVEDGAAYDVREDRSGGVKIVIKLTPAMVAALHDSDDIEWLDAVADMLGGDVVDVFAAVFVGDGEDLDEG
jgi:hypothetical protein